MIDANHKNIQEFINLAKTSLNPTSSILSNDERSANNVKASSKSNSLRSSEKSKNSKSSPHKATIGIYAKDINIHSEHIKNTSKITANNTKMESKFILNQNGVIQAREQVNIKAQTLSNKGAQILAKDLNVKANAISISSIVDKSSLNTNNPTTAAPSLVNHLFSLHLPSSNSSASFISSASLLKADNISLDAKEEIAISASTINAKNNLSIKSNNIDITTQRISNAHNVYARGNFSNTEAFKSYEDIGSSIVASNIKLHAQDSLTLSASSLSAQHNLSLSSGGNMIFNAGEKHIQKQTHSFAHEDFLFVQKQTQTSTHYLKNTALGNALKANNISINAQNLISAGTSYEAKDTLSIEVKNDYLESGAKNISLDEHSTSSANNALGFIPILNKDSQNSDSSQTYTHSRFKATHIAISAKNHLTLLGVDSTSVDDTNLSSGQNTIITSLKESFSHFEHSSKSILGKMYQKEVQDGATNEILKKNHFDSNKDFNLKSFGDILIKGSDITASKDLSIEGQNNVSIENDYDVHSSTHTLKTQGFKGVVFDVNRSGIDLGVSFSTTEHSQNIQSSKVVSSDISGNNLSIISHNKDIFIKGSNLSSGENLSLNAKGNVNIVNADNSDKQTDSSIEGELQVLVHVGNTYLDAINATTALNQSKDKLLKAQDNLKEIQQLYKEHKASKEALDDAKANVAFMGINVANSALNLSTSIASAANGASSSYGTGFYASINTTLKGSKDWNETSSTSVVSSNLLSHKNISIHAGDSISQVGSNAYSTNGNISYNATKDISISAGINKMQHKSTHEVISSTTSFGNNGLGESIAGEKAQSSFSSTKALASTLLAQNGSISLNSNQSVSLQGANASSKDIVINTKDFNLISVQDSTSSTSKGFSSQMGFDTGKGGNGGGAFIGLGVQKGYEKSDWVQTQSSVIGSASVKVNVKDNTFIQGGILASGEFISKTNDETTFISNKNLSLKTKHLVLKDINNSAQSQDVSIGLNTSLTHKQDDINGNSTINVNHDQSISNQSVYAILTPGDIQVQDDALINPSIDKPNSISMHQDVNASRSAINNELMHHLDISANFDHRLFNKQGIFNIAQTFKELPSNVLQIGKALKNNIISQSIKNTLNDKDTSLFKAFKDYARDDALIEQIQDNPKLTNYLNALTSLDPEQMQSILQDTVQIASKEGGFNAKVSLYNNEINTKGYAYEDNNHTNEYSNIIGFNTLSNDLNNSKEIINTLFHESTNKALHHSNEQRAKNRGDSAGNIWELKNYHHINNNPLSTLEWNKQYSSILDSKDDALYEGNILNSQIKQNTALGYGYRDERTIFVHGTKFPPWGSSEKFSKEAFLEDFKQAIAKTFNDPNQEDFIWSGQNNKPARTRAAKELLKQIQKPYDYKPGEELNIIAHSHGGNVVKEMSNLYDYSKYKTPIIVNIATPNRKDYVMSPNVKEFYNVYNAKDEFIQGFAGGYDFSSGESRIPRIRFIDHSNQLAREPNAVNIKIDKDFGNFLNNHSKVKNPETVKILEDVMKQRRGE
ncbi:hemagglutinin repeat-containing protein [Helicobacter sp. 13S00482-2]|uniref:hemagglutinin repeat-containing protein n=1 Tax=Helicobacter sp. 13S00482-2 TaxID=1476200 RepID=UPI001C5F8BB3|nr:hemagglutinin repeat-containing protein [Helicobacter sp. 13S00482-2]